MHTFTRACIRGMVVGMETIAIEFTLTYAGLVKQGEVDLGPSRDDMRCRVVVDRIRGVQVFWRESNELGEDIWRGGNHDSGPPLSIRGNGIHISQDDILVQAMRLMSQSLDAQLVVEKRHLSNGSVVFDLGTV
jgi:hypothetical protein